MSAWPVGVWDRDRAVNAHPLPPPPAGGVDFTYTKGGRLPCANPFGGFALSCSSHSVPVWRRLRAGMGRALRQITNDALALSEVDRLALAAELIDSVEGSDDSEWNAEWSAEIDRRVEEADRTGERGRLWDVVRSELLERLARR